MDLFQAATTEDLFTGVAPTPATASPVSPKAKQKAAMVGALAQTDPSKPDLLGQLDGLIDQTRNTIELVGDMSLREQIAAKRARNQFGTLNSLLQDRELAQDPSITLGAVKAAEQLLATDYSKAAAYALEQETAERIQDLAAAGDTTQARLLLNNLEYGNTNQVIRDQTAKIMMLEKKINELDAETEGDWIGSATNFILSAVPLYMSTGQVGNVDIEKGLKGWADWMFSGRRLQLESNSLWNTPIDQFEDRLDEIISQIRDKSTLLGFEDKNKALATLSKLQRPSGVLTQNLWDGVANLGFIGPMELARAASIPGMLVRNGARKETADILARTALEIKMGGADAGATKTAIDADELIDNMLPDSVNPQTQMYSTKVDINGEEFDIDIDNLMGPQTEGKASVVSLQAEVNDVFERTQALMEQFQGLHQLGRLTTAELDAAVDATINRIKKVHGEDWVKDIAVKDVKLSDGTQFKRVEFTLGTFDSQDDALKYAREMGFGENIELTSNADRMIRVVPGLPTASQPLFGKWFAGSKVVDSDGVTPKKMYHGTTNWATVRDGFVPGKGAYAYSKKHGGYAIFFAEDSKTIKSFNYGHDFDSPAGGASIPVYIKAVNPFDPKNNPEHQKQWIDWLVNTPQGNKVASYYVNDPYDAAGKNIEITVDKVMTGKGDDRAQGVWNAMEHQSAIDWYLGLGHDGAYVYSKSEGRNLMVWDPEQVVNALEPSDVAARIVKDQSGQYSFRLAKDVDETGFATEVLKPPARGFLSRVLLSSRAVGDRRLANMGQSGGNTRAKLLKSFIKDSTKKFAVLSRREREDLAQVLAIGENNAEWYSRDQIEMLYERAFKRPPSERELIAYDTARNLNDIEYMMLNDEVYKRLAVSGHEDIQWGGQYRANGKVLQDWNVLPTDRVYDISSNTSYSKINPLLSDKAQILKDEGYVLVKLDGTVELPDGTTTNAILGKKSDFTIQPLRREQVPYRAGGHRIYKEKYFLKQARIGTQPDGEKFLKNPGVFSVGTKAEIDYLTTRLEAARLLWKDDAPREAISAALPSSITIDDFIAKMVDGTFDQNVPFRTAFDRETLPEYLNTHGYTDMRNLDETDIEQYLRTSGRMYYGHKGETLPDFRGMMAPTLDPYMTINRALHNVAQLASFGDYKISAAERWYKTFGGYLDRPDLSPMQALRTGQFGLDAPEPIRQAAEAQRDVIKRTLGWKTEFDRQQEIYTRRFSEWVAGDDPYSIRNKVASSISNWWETTNPVQKLRGLAFDLKLGLLNVGQFPLQIGTLIAATTISPKYGMQGMVGLWPMRAYLTKTSGDEVLDLLIQRGNHTATGFADPKEYKDYMKFAKQSGFFDLGSTHQLINDYGPNAAVGAFNKTENAREALRFFFYEAEMWNRIIAYRIAWGETREKLPNLAIGSPEFRAEVTGKMEEFSFSMSDQSAAAWQKGITSIPTQFWAYNARMLEAMLGKTFTPEQKVRLVIGQTMLYGAAGVPVAPFIMEQIAKAKGEAPKPGTLEGLVARGWIDTALAQMTGQDLLISQRFGTGSFWTDTIKDIFGMSSYGEKSAAELLGGASGNIAWAGLETIGQLIKYSAAESGDTEMPLTKESLLRLAANISTISNLHKAYIVHKYGEMISNKGTVLANDLPDATAFAVALGIQPGEVDQVTAAMGFIKDENKAVDEAVRTINNYRTRWVNELDRREEIEQEINAYVRLLPPEIKVQALQGVQRRLQPSLVDGLNMQVEKDRIRAEALRKMEGENGSDGNP